MQFSLDKLQQDKLLAWMREQDAKVYQEQQDNPHFKGRYSSAYYGASGGAYTFLFTPTTLGTVIVVRNTVTQNEIDLTDYDSW